MACGPGFFATALTGIAVDYFVFPPTGNFGFSQPLDFAQWLFLLLVGVLISVLFARAHAARAVPSCTRRWNCGTPRPSARSASASRWRVAFLGTIGIVSYLSVVRLNENSRLVAHSQLVMSNIDALVATTWETESAQRAYLITGEEPFAAEYTRATGRVDGSGAAAARRGQRRCRRSWRASSRWPRRCARACGRAREILDLRRAGGIEAVQRRLAQSPAAPGRAPAGARARARAGDEDRRRSGC